MVLPRSHDPIAKAAGLDDATRRNNTMIQELVLLEQVNLPGPSLGAECRAAVSLVFGEGEFSVFDRPIPAEEADGEVL